MCLVNTIVIENNKDNPRLIIADERHFLKGIELVKKDNSYNDKLIGVNDKLELPSSYFIKNDSYNGKKLDNRLFAFGKTFNISEVNIRLIASLSLEGYCKVLRKYISYQAFMGDEDKDYFLVRNTVTNQLIKMMDKGIYGR